LRGRRGCGGGVRKTHNHHYLSFVISTYVSVIIILSERERERKKNPFFEGLWYLRYDSYKTKK
jgi:hypothetical protein